MPSRPQLLRLSLAVLTLVPMLAPLTSSPVDLGNYPSSALAAALEPLLPCQPPFPVLLEPRSSS